jgi:hypothetical protein
LCFQKIHKGFSGSNPPTHKGNPQGSLFNEAGTKNPESRTKIQPEQKTLKISSVMGWIRHLGIFFFGAALSLSIALYSAGPRSPHGSGFEDLSTQVTRSVIIGNPPLWDEFVRGGALLKGTWDGEKKKKKKKKHKLWHKPPAHN